MVLNPPIERLHLALTALVELERRVQQTTANLSGVISVYLAAQDLLARLVEMAGTHLDALCERLRITPDNDPNSRAVVNGLSPIQSQFGELHPVSNALGVIYTILQEAVIGYSTIQPIALRAQDSWVMGVGGRRTSLPVHVPQL